MVGLGFDHVGKVCGRRWASSVSADACQFGLKSDWPNSIGHLLSNVQKTFCKTNKKQIRIHDSISRVKMGRGNDASSICYLP